MSPPFLMLCISYVYTIYKFISPSPPPPPRPPPTQMRAANLPVPKDPPPQHIQSSLCLPGAAPFKFLKPTFAAEFGKSKMHSANVTVVSSPDPTLSQSGDYCALVVLSQQS